MKFPITRPVNVGNIPNNKVGINNTILYCLAVIASSQWQYGANLLHMIPNLMLLVPLFA